MTSYVVAAKIAYADKVLFEDIMTEWWFSRASLRSQGIELIQARWTMRTLPQLWNTL